nr:ATP-binding protein [Pseudenhygromyxa sp. WMMC2535]
MLQNARDAGASRVEIVVEERNGRTRLHCRDDGEGMSYEHARRYLFSLYASSKEERSNQVGRFGVGFWSILRFDPEQIVIRSRPRAGGASWQVSLDGALQDAVKADVETQPGTQIVLERRGGDGDDHRRVFEAAHQNARFLCQRDAPDKALPITINGHLVNAPFTLPAPSSAFRRGHVRGVVGLGNAPRVELFSRGLRVRSAACLDDLLGSSGHTSHSRVRFPELPGGLAPQALLESDGLDLLLSRSDARDTRTLRRLVKLGQNELRHLVERQLARIRPPSLAERVAGIARRMSESHWWRAGLGAGLGALLAVIIGHFLWPTPDPPPKVVYVEAGDPNNAGGAVDGGQGDTRLGALSNRYYGQDVAPLGPNAAEPVALNYWPPMSRPYFAALIIDRIGVDAQLETRLRAEPYPSFSCPAEAETETETEAVSGRCLEILVAIEEHAGKRIQVPVPTGHVLVADSLRYMGVNQSRFPSRVALGEAGEALLELDATVSGVLRYSTMPGQALALPTRVDMLPEELARAARALRPLPLQTRVERAVDLVRERVSYRTDQETAERHSAARARGQDFISRTLEIGKGDCDVQNGLLVAVLQVADVDARMAVGWVGHLGGVSAWLHAWAEYLGEDGRWHVADATAQSTSDGVSVAGLPPAPPEVVTGNVLEPDEAADAGEDAGADTDADAGAGEDAGADAGEDAGADTGADAGEGGGALEGEGPRSPVSAALIALLSQPWVPWVAMGSGLLGLILLGVSASRRTARRFLLDEGGDLSSLLQGALAQPAAFRHLPSLFHRRLIALRGGSAISLQRARELASEGRLYAGGEQTELCRLARRRGVTVLDVETPEGRTVAASLGAVDLDRWGGRLERALQTPLLLGLADYLNSQGERWRVGAVSKLGERISTLDLRALRGLFGVGRRFGDRLVLIEADDPWLIEAEHARAEHPEAAAFALLDHVLDHLHLDRQRRARLLAPLAARALAESAQAARAARAGDDRGGPPA